MSDNVVAAFLAIICGASGTIVYLLATWFCKTWEVELRIRRRNKQ